MGLLPPFLENRKSESTAATVATGATFQPPHRQKSRESQLSQPYILKIKITGTASKRLPPRLHPLKSAARPCSAAETTIVELSDCRKNKTITTYWWVLPIFGRHNDYSFSKHGKEKHVFSYGVLLLHKGSGVLYFNRFLFVRHASRRNGLAASITRHG
jgi:hypothetical protein